MNEILLISLVVSLFCVGLRFISSKGMILYFLRQPYEKLENRLKHKKSTKAILHSNFNTFKNELDRLLNLPLEEQDQKRIVTTQHAVIESKSSYDEYLRKTNWIILVMNVTLYILKPIIGCGTCMASVWTIVWWTYMDLEWTPRIFLVMFIAAAGNTLVIQLFDLMKKNTDNAFIKKQQGPS